MTRNQSHFDMRGRGLSTIGLKALCCAMYSRAPDFDQIRKVHGGGEVTQYLIKYPEETFKVAMGAPDVFKLRKEQLCVQMSVLDLSDNDFRAQGCQDLVEVLPQTLDTKTRPCTIHPCIMQFAADPNIWIKTHVRYIPVSCNLRLSTPALT
jgi:hypothetical protein